MGGFPFCATLEHGILVVRLGGARRPAAAVAAGAPAEQDHDVARLRRIADDCVLADRAHNRADFHALGHIALMIDFRNLPGCQTDLVAVGAVARRSRLADFALHKLTGQRLCHGGAHVAAPGHAHCLIDVSAPGQRIANSAAETRRRTAERFDFRRMVVRLVFKQEQPFFDLSIHIYIHMDAAGVDFLGFIQFG